MARNGLAVIALVGMLMHPEVSSGQSATPVAPVRPAATRPAPPVFDQGTFNSWSLITDNDVYPQWGGNDDRNYTAGFGFLFSGSFVRKAGLAAPLHGIDRLTGMRKAAKAFDNHYYSTALVGTGFTPDMLNTRAIVQGDRPYGSIVAVSVRRLMVDSATKAQTWSSEFQVGMLGLSAARRVQSGIHSYLRKKNNSEEPYAPLGWHNQISDGGELTGLYRVGYERLIAGAETGPASGWKHFQASAGAIATAGYYTDLTGQLGARLGWFTSDFWEFSPGIMTMSPQKLVTDPPKRFEFFAFGYIRPRLVGYSALLQGQFKDSVYTVTPKRLQAEWDFGVGLTVPINSRHQFNLAWEAYPGRSAEFVGSMARTHTWGGFKATLTHASGKK